MKKIVANHTNIDIYDYEPGECEALEYFFSIRDIIRHTRNPFGLYYDDNNRMLKIPRGVDIPYIQDLFKSQVIINKRHDPIGKVPGIMLKSMPRDNKQKETLKFMLGLPPYQYTASKSQLCVNLPTGSGKTYCSIYLIARLRLRSMIITSSIEWLDQWKKSIMQFTDIKHNEIFTISGVGSIYGLLNKSDISQYKIILCSIQTLKSYGEKKGWDKVSELFRYLKIGVKFYDEAHLYFESMCMIDFFTDTYKTYYLSATPARSNEEEDRIYKSYFKNIPKIDLFDEKVDPHTKYLSIRYNSHPTIEELSYCKNKYGLDRIKYISEYITHKKEFMDLIEVVMNIVLKLKGKTLIYIGVNESINVVKGYLEAIYPQLVGDIGVYNSTVPKEIKKQQLEKRIILSTTKSCGAAMDIKGLKCTVVLAEPFKSIPLAIQTFGRTRDKDTLYIECVDEGFKQIYKYYLWKKPTYKKYATEMKDIRFTHDDLELTANNVALKRIGEPTLPLFKVIPKPLLFKRI